jgi:hypothetical protein
MPFRTAVSLAGTVPGIGACRAEPLAGKMFIMGPYTGVDTMSTLHYYSLMNATENPICETCEKPIHFTGITCPDHPAYEIWMHDHLIDTMHCPSTTPHIEPAGV